MFALELALQRVAPHVRCEFFVHRERRLALSTLETGRRTYQITMLCLHVLLRLLGLREGCVADGAQIRLLARMFPHVCIQASLESEGHAALFAGERPILPVTCCMDLAVALQSVGFFEGGAAVLAFVLHARSVLGFPTTLLPFTGAGLV